MRSSIPAERWAQNASFFDRLRRDVRAHPVARHPAIAALNAGVFNKDAMKRIHLDYRHAIVQTFTDALLMAQHQSLQLEPRLAPGSKMAARFLLTLNVLDEFGFRPGLDRNGYYRGNPSFAHYPLFEQVLSDYGISSPERRDHAPSPTAGALRRFLEDSYDDFTTVTALLAVAEEEVILFSPPLRKNTAAVGLDVASGYYNVHGTSEDKTAEAADDDHEDDLWHVLTQAAVPEQYGAIQDKCLQYCDLWSEFWTHQMRLLRSGRPREAAMV